VLGGSGNDTITVGSVLKSVIDAGDGNDRVTIGMTGGNQTITLGAGSDVLTLNGDAYAFAVGNPTRVVDFQVGTDTLNIDQYLGNVLSGWDKTTNPFATGFSNSIATAMPAPVMACRRSSPSATPRRQALPAGTSDTRRTDRPQQDRLLPGRGTSTR
jgi:hypothetical protein